MKNKKYVKLAGLLVAVMFLSTMMPVNAVDNQESEYEITDVLNGATLIISDDPELPAGGIPPGERRSFVYMSGMYEEYEGVNRLVGVWWNLWLWFDDFPHTLALLGLVALEIVEGEYQGEYVFPEWFLHAGWTGNASLIPMSMGLGYYWNPNDNKLGYFHCFADYTEDDEHIRYIDRTFKEDWSTPDCDVDMNGQIYFGDLIAIVMRYGETGQPGWMREDVDNNGHIYFDDLIAVVMDYGEYWK